MSDTNTEAAPTQAETTAPLESFEEAISAIENAEQAQPEATQEAQGEGEAQGSVQAPESVQETPQEPTEPVAPPEPILPEELRALAEKEQELFRQQQLLKDSMSKGDELKAKMRQNPLGTLQEEFGLDYTTLTEHAAGLKGEKDSELGEIKHTLNQLAEQNKALQAKLEAAEHEKQEALYASQVSNYITSQKLEDGSSKYGLVTDMFTPEEASAQVRSVIQSTLQSTGGKQRLTVDQAATALNQEIKEQLTRLAKGEHGQKILAELYSASKPAPTATDNTATATLGNTSAGVTTHPEQDDNFENFEDLLAQYQE